MLGKVFIHYLAHVIPVALLGGILAYLRREPSILFLSCLFAVLIDIDHFVDYLLFPKREGFSFRDAVQCAHFKEAERIYLPLHAYDLHAIVTLGLYYVGWHDLAGAWCIGFIGHIATDEILGHSKGTNRFRNTLTYRVINGFSRKLHDPQ